MIFIHVGIKGNVGNLINAGKKNMISYKVDVVVTTGLVYCDDNHDVISTLLCVKG